MLDYLTLCMFLFPQLNTLSSISKLTISSLHDDIYTGSLLQIRGPVSSADTRLIRRQLDFSLGYLLESIGCK